MLSSLQTQIEPSDRLNIVGWNALSPNWSRGCFGNFWGDAERLVLGWKMVDELRRYDMGKRLESGTPARDRQKRERVSA